MNDLNLRVAALKLCAHPKRFAEMRNALVPVPLKWMNLQAEYVQKFAEAKNCAKQLSIVKDAFDDPHSFTFLADILFVCPLKHPVRGVLTRLFSSGECAKRSLPTHTKEILLNALRGALLQQALNISNCSPVAEDMNNVFVSVSGCLQSFPFGRDALAQEIYNFIPLLPNALQLYWSSLSDSECQLSPTRRNEYYLYIQNLLRFHVNFMTEYKYELVAERCKPLQLIDEFAEQTARHVDTPWDVRAIAGLAIGHNARLFDQFDEYLHKCQQMDDFNDVPIKAASLLLLQKSDYSVYAAQALDILKRTLDHAKDASNFTNFLVYLSKHLNTYSKSLGNIHLTDRSQIMYSLILAILMRFALEHISSNVESIRHMSANMLNQVLQHCKATGQTNIISQVYTQYERQRMPLAAVCLMLQQVVEVVGAKTVMQHCPGIFEKMFPKHLGLEDSVNSLFKCMMTAAHKEESSMDWQRVWCTVLYKAAQPCDDRLVHIERLIKVAVQLDDGVLPQLMDQRNLAFSTKLAAMLTARRHGQHRFVKELIVDHVDQLRTALGGVDDNTRLLALCFVVDTPRLSEPYSQFELESILNYLRLNANNPSAHMRQIGHGLMQKAVKRLDFNLSQQIKEHPLSLTEDHMLIVFVTRMFHILSMNLFPTANYGRRWLSMRVLYDCIEVMERLNLPWLNRMPPQALPHVDHCLRDSYEHNKVQAAMLLNKMQRCCHYRPTDLLDQLKSVRPPDSITAAYRLQVYCKAAQVAIPPNDLPTGMTPKHHARDFAILQMCMEQLRSGIALAEEDLTKAAKLNPLYGLLFASRHLLMQLEFKPLAEEQIWRDYIDELLKMCIKICDIMLPIVSSESPEGILPETLKRMAKAGLQAEAGEQAEAAEAGEQAEAAEAGEQAEAAEAGEPVEAAEPGEPVEAVDAAAPVETVVAEEAAAPVESEEAGEPVEAAEPVEATAAEAVVAEEAAASVEAAEAGEAAASTEAEGAAAPEEAGEAAASTEAEGAAASAEAAEAGEAAASTESEGAAASTEAEGAAASTEAEGAAAPADDADAQAELDTLSMMPQLVLLCAWRSVREIALLMGDLVQRAPLEQERNNNYLLSKEQVSQIGEQFLLLLSEVKHRGAFEQTYVGFTWLCRRFWHSDEPALNQLPPKWMDEAMRLVIGDGDKELCATRRSAGMPYMLQALICTELKLGTHNTFNRSMSLLLDVCERRDPSPEAATARTHAMNIMRALFRSSELADVVDEFVGRGIRCALESLMAVEWNERNSATLMLSALMVRVFGVERARTDNGELHVRNRMTGRIFFTRYPYLFDYFFESLKKAAASCKASPMSGQTAQLEATMQLLCRLYPSSMEGAESSLNLTAFLPFLEEISGVHDNTTRYRSCLVMANFMNATMAIKRIRHLTMIFHVINVKYKRGHPMPNDKNRLHGKVLQLKELYRIARWQDVRLTTTMMYTLAMVAMKIFDYDIFIFRSLVMVLTDALQDLANAKHIGATLLTALLNIYNLDHMEIYRRAKLYAVSPKFFAMFGLNLYRLTHKPDSLLEPTLQMLARPERLPPQLQQVKVDLWLYALIHQTGSSSMTRGLIESFEIKYFEFDPDVVIFYKSLTYNQRTALASDLRKTEEVQLHMMKIALMIKRSPEWAPGLASRVFTVLAMLNTITLTLRRLLDRGGFDAEPGVIICLTRLIMQNGMLQQYQPYWLALIRYTLHIASPKKPIYLRYRAAQMLDRLTVHVQQILFSDDVFMVGGYIRLVLQLLVDESEMVRNYTAELVSSCMGVYLNGERSLDTLSDCSLLPIEAERYFLQHVLQGLQHYKTNGCFLIATFNMIVEPFVSVELLSFRLVEEEPDKTLTGGGEEDSDGDVFDKQELNMYCEGLRVVSEVAKAFKNAFPNNKELMYALNALEKLCSFNGFGDHPIPPRIIS